MTFVMMYLSGATQMPLPGLRPEKVYLHVDRSYYAAGEQIWFQGYLDGASPETDTSRFLYVELLAQEEEDAVARIKVRRRGEGFPGSLLIPDTLTSGCYVLRAYTRWQMNRGEQWMFHMPVRVFGIDGEDGVNVPPAGDIDISFYPEGGRFFPGESASIGFKAMSPDGSSVHVIGKVVNDLGQEVATARTIHQGMGLLVFVPEEGMRYRFVEDDTGTAWPLPLPSTSGATIQVRRSGSYLTIKAINRSGNLLKLLINDGNGNYEVSPVAEGSYTLRLMESELNAGLQKFILVDAEGRICAERAFYRYDTRSPIARLSVETDDDGYFPRIQKKLKLRLPEGVDTAMVSVSVVSGAFRDWRQEGGIGSYMLLCSELNGHVSAPDYYFNEEIPVQQRRSNLDLLLLIQGWKYYDDPYQSAACPKETTQSLSGIIRGFSRKARPKDYLFSVMAPGLNYSQVAQVSAGGHFIIDSLDFRDSTLFILSVTRNGLLQSYAPVIDETPFAQQPADRWMWHVPRYLRPETAPVNDISPFSPDLFTKDTIPTAIIHGTINTIRSPFDSSNLPNIKDREALSPYDHLSLLEYVTMMHPSLHLDGDNLINLTSGYSNLNGDQFSTIALYVNGLKMTWDIGSTIYMSDIEKLSITTHLNSDAFLANSPDGIVLAELSRPHDRTMKDSWNSRICVPLGYQSPRNFYHPRYDRPSAWKPDMRNTLFWEPSVRLSRRKVTVIPFYTDDKADGPYLLRIEGCTGDGRWISEERIF